MVERIELIDDATASHPASGETYTAAGNRHGPVPPLVRRLIHMKILEPDCLIEIGRGDKLSFEAVPAERWAAVDYSESSQNGLQVFDAFIGPHADSPKARRLQELTKRQ